jgi:Restriction endonuclease
MDWRQYEEAVFEEIASVYPRAEVLFDQKYMGRFSRRLRQCDVVINERIGTRKVSTLVDAKFRNRAINVKDVEAFAGQLRDIGFDRGMIIAPRGFSKAAENLALFGEDKLDLDLLSMSELQPMQGTGAIPYNTQIALLLRSPLGWITDASRRDGMVAAFYQRGLTFEEALSRREFAYLNFWSLENDQKVGDLINLQNDSLRDSYGGNTEISQERIQSEIHSDVWVRRVEFPSSEFCETTVFVVYADVVAFAVAHSCAARAGKIQRKVLHMMALSLPMTMKSEVPR